MEDCSSFFPHRENLAEIKNNQSKFFFNFNKNVPTYRQLIKENLISIFKSYPIFQRNHKLNLLDIVFRVINHSTKKKFVDGLFICVSGSMTRFFYGTCSGYLF